ncbi:hypothetical protein B9Y75_00975 [Stenotrophomonas maltophilia]|nr:hypothetical protein B9Y75_00975 [Stenotrophomonas maltophilia]PZT05797.1 hypothetical protein A7X89_11730 [Stenotrophomonas maltophilia]
MELTFFKECKMAEEKKAVTLSSVDQKKVNRLAREGMKLVDIRREHFPEVKYSALRAVVLDTGSQSAIGRFKAINKELALMAQATTGAQRKELAASLSARIKSLHEDYIRSAKKLDQVRDVLQK